MTGDRRFGLRNVLVAVQVALSLALVVGGVLFVRTLTALSSRNLGFDPEGVVSINVDARKNDDSRAARLQLFERLRGVAAAVPGVSTAAASVLTPLGTMRWNTRIEPTPAVAGLPEKQRLVWVNIVSPAWFKTFGMRVLQGRDFETHDTSNAAARADRQRGLRPQVLPGRTGDGPGDQERARRSGDPLYRIVGVVNDAIYSSPRKDFEPTIYAPLEQLTEVMSSTVISVRAANGQPGTLTRDLVVRDGADRSEHRFHHQTDLRAVARGAAAGAPRRDAGWILRRAGAAARRDRPLRRGFAFRDPPPG